MYLSLLLSFVSNIFMTVNYEKDNSYISHSNDLLQHVNTFESGMNYSAQSMNSVRNENTTACMSFGSFPVQNITQNHTSPIDSNENYKRSQLRIYAQNETLICNTHRSIKLNSTTFGDFSCEEESLLRPSHYQNNCNTLEPSLTFEGQSSSLNTQIFNYTPVAQQPLIPTLLSNQQKSIEVNSDVSNEMSKNYICDQSVHLFLNSELESQKVSEPFFTEKYSQDTNNKLFNSGNNNQIEYFDYVSFPNSSLNESNELLSAECSTLKCLKSTIPSSHLNCEINGVDFNKKLNSETANASLPHFTETFFPQYIHNKFLDIYPLNDIHLPLDFVDDKVQNNTMKGNLPFNQEKGKKRKLDKEKYIEGCKISDSVSSFHIETKNPPSNLTINDEESHKVDSNHLCTLLYTQNDSIQSTKTFHNNSLKIATDILSSMPESSFNQNNYEVTFNKFHESVISSNSQRSINEQHKKETEYKTQETEPAQFILQRTQESSLKNFKNKIYESSEVNSLKNKIKYSSNPKATQIHKKKSEMKVAKENILLLSSITELRIKYSPFFTELFDSLKSSLEKQLTLKKIKGKTQKTITQQYRNSNDSTICEKNYAHVFNNYQVNLSEITTFSKPQFILQDLIKFLDLQYLSYKVKSESYHLKWMQTFLKFIIDIIANDKEPDYQKYIQELRLYNFVSDANIFLQSRRIVLKKIMDSKNELFNIFKKKYKEPEVELQIFIKIFYEIFQVKITPKNCNINNLLKKFFTENKESFIKVLRGSRKMDFKNFIEVPLFEITNRIIFYSFILMKKIILEINSISQEFSEYFDKDLVIFSYNQIATLQYNFLSFSSVSLENLIPPDLVIKNVFCFFSIYEDTPNILFPLEARNIALEINEIIFRSFHQKNGFILKYMFLNPKSYLIRLFLVAQILGFKEIFKQAANSDGEANLRFTSHFISILFLSTNLSNKTKFYQQYLNEKTFFSRVFEETIVFNCLN